MACRRTNPLLRPGLVLLTASVLMSCASTKMTSTWRDSNDAGGPLKKIAVFVVEVVEMVLCTLPEGKPIWKATSESVNPNSSNELVVEIARQVEIELQQETRVGAP